jgi:hypothetical protein
LAVEVGNDEAILCPDCLHQTTNAQNADRTGSSAIGEKSSSTERWNDVPHGTMDEVSSYDLDEDARDVARSLAITPAYERSRHRRKKIEMLFAHLKRILRLGRLRLRGPSGARDEFLLAATAQNLRKLAKLRAMPAACPVPA